MNWETRLFLFAFFLLCSAFFAGIETGIISINRLRLRHLSRHKVKGAVIVERFLKKPEWLLGTTLAGTNLSHVILSVMATSLAADTMGASGPAVASVLTTLLLLVLGEYIPKAWFQSFPTGRVLPLARTLEITGYILLPLSWTISLIARILPGAREDKSASGPFLTREDLLHLTTEGARSGALTPDESRMIHGVFALSGKKCGDLMIPRAQMVVVNETMTVDELIRFAREKDVSRFPVWSDAQKNFTGIVSVYDILIGAPAPDKTMAEVKRPPQFTADYTLVDHVLPRMRVTKQPLVMVTNERFEVVGIITLDDVLSEIVGDA